MHSLRRTLAVRFSLTMFLGLLLISLWAFLGTHSRISDQLDAGLGSAEQLEAAVLAARLPLAFDSASNDLDEFVERVNRFVIVRDSLGRASATNTTFAASIPVDSASFEAARHGGTAWTTQMWENQRIRSLYAAVPENSLEGYAVMQVAASLEPLSRADRRIFLLMLGTVIFGTVATLVGAGWLADSAVSPIAAVTAQAQAITPGTPGHRISAQANVTEFKGLVGVLNNMLERLDGALQTQRRIIADLGHDIRTPLTAMRGELEVALRSAREPVQYRAVLESCLEEVEHLNSISEALILLARLEAGELSPRRTPTDVSRLIAKTVSSAQSRSGDHSIEFITDPDIDTVASADGKMLRIVLNHLLDNAITHTPPGSRVRVSVTSAPSRLWVAVEDDGPGIDDDELPFLFERLYRGDAARSRTGGVGLGLTIASTILAAHGGTIKAERSRLGGLAIRICLPLATSAEDRPVCPADG
ncbi:MAG: sensor histidine kinase [Gemmatimonadales bacterium]